MNTPYIFFHDPVTTAIYTLSLHDALPISLGDVGNAGGEDAALSGELLVDLVGHVVGRQAQVGRQRGLALAALDRKSTRLNSSHLGISYAVFCLKKKNMSDDCIVLDCVFYW